MGLKNLINRLKYNPLGQKTKKRGVALILAMTSLMFMVYIASEVTRDSAVEYIVNSQELNRLKAYYAARNGLQMALLRIKIYQQVSQNKLPENLQEIVDRIGWKEPFFWPIQIPGNLNAVDKDSLTETSASSLFDASYSHSIENEGSKIDINDLASPSKTLQEVTRKQLLNVFEQKNETDDDFRAQYQNYNFEDLVNKITDWITDSNESVGGGDKQSHFSDLGSSYPPNRGFRTIEELRLVPGMTDELFDLLSPRVTIYGMKAINPNIANKEVLLSLDKGMTEEAVKEAMEFRSGPTGPFKGEGEKCRENFKGFIESRGARLGPEFDKIPMVCNKVYNFKIKSDGIFGTGSHSIRKTITAIVFDVSKTANVLKTYVDKERKEANPGASNPAGANPASGDQTGSTSGAPKQDLLPKGPPRIVYWTEN